MDELFFEVCFGCWGFVPAPRTIICHWDGDHIPASSVRIYAPFFPPGKYRRYARNTSVLDGRDLKNNVISTNSLRIVIKPLLIRDIKEITGREHRFHSSSKSAVPLLITVYKDREVGIYLYIDDLDADDFEILEELVDHYNFTHKNFFRGVIFPVYLGTNAHKTKYPKELRELSMNFARRIAEKGIDVYIIPHADGVTKNLVTSELSHTDRIHALTRVYQPACSEKSGH